MREHELGPDLERLMLDRAPAVANWGRLYDETLARMAIEVDGGLAGGLQILFQLGIAAARIQVVQAPLGQFVQGGGGRRGVHGHRARYGAGRGRGQCQILDRGLNRTFTAFEP